MANIYRNDKVSLIMLESEILKVQASSGNVDVIASILEINREDR